MPVFNPITQEEMEEEDDLCEFYANLGYIASSRPVKKSKYSSRNKSNKGSERKTCTMSIKILNRVKTTLKNAKTIHDGTLVKLVV